MGYLEGYMVKHIFVVSIREGQVHNEGIKEKRGVVRRFELKGEGLCGCFCMCRSFAFPMRRPRTMAELRVASHFK